MTTWKRCLLSGIAILGLAGLASLGVALADTKLDAANKAAERDAAHKAERERAEACLAAAEAAQRNAESRIIEERRQADERVTAAQERADERVAAAEQRAAAEWEAKMAPVRKAAGENLARAVGAEKATREVEAKLASTEKNLRETEAKQLASENAARELEARIADAQKIAQKREEELTAARTAAETTLLAERARHAWELALTKARSRLDLVAQQFAAHLTTTTTVKAVEVQTAKLVRKFLELPERGGTFEDKVAVLECLLTGDLSRYIGEPDGTAVGPPSVARIERVILTLGGQVTKRPIKGSEEIVAVNFANSSVRDEYLVVLQWMPYLGSLDLSSTAVTGEGLKFLPADTLLLSLKLGESTQSEALRSVGRFPRLESLSVPASRLSDEDLRYLRLENPSLRIDQK